MSSNIKAATSELIGLAKNIKFKKDLLADIKEGEAKVAKLLQQIKESQEEVKVILAANLDYFTVEQEMKELVKELKQGAKAAVKGTGFKTAQFVAFLHAKVKDDAVEKTVEKGQIFSALANQSN